MANPEHVAILKQGVEAWNVWRETNGSTLSMRASVELEKARLTANDLAGIDLTGANLTGANLAGANLTGSNLTEANLTEADLTGSYLVKAKLSKANMKKAKLSRASLSMADLTGAYIAGAELIRADLVEADLTGANLIKAGLIGAILKRSNLTGAVLKGAGLLQADLSGAVLPGAILDKAVTGGTLFIDIDISQTKGLETIQHLFPSIIGIDTIYRSRGNIPEVFLRGCGVPGDFLTAMKLLVGSPIDYYSCFISHSALDIQFIDRLYVDLQAKGIRTWYFPEDAQWGETVWGEIDKSIKLYDKLVVVCSENSLQSGPVVREIERALNREDREHKNILFPVRIDDYLFHKWDHPRKDDVTAKVVGDFRQWKNVDKYQDAFNRLLKNLKAATPPA